MKALVTRPDNGTPLIVESVALDTAYHEAGHIALALHARRVPFGATIVPTEERLGAVLQRCAGSFDDVQTWRKLGWGGVPLRLEAVQLLAGAAVDRRRGLPNVGYERDIAHARLALTALYGDAKRAHEELPRVLAEAQAIVARPEVWRAIELIAGELQARRELWGMRMLRLMLKAALIIHGQERAGQEMRIWKGYADLAESAGRDPLFRLNAEDFLPLILWPAGALVLLMHAIMGS